MSKNRQVYDVSGVSDDWNLIDAVITMLGTRKFWFRAVAVSFAVLLGFFLWQSLVIVQPGYVGVQIMLGKASDAQLEEGMHFIVPIITRVYPVDVRIQKTETTSEAASKDLQTVKSSVIVNHHLQKDNTVTVYREIGLRYADIVISPGVQEVFKAAVSTYTAEQLISERQKVSEQIQKSLQTRLEPYGIKIDLVNIVEFNFSDEFNKSVEKKVTAEQDALAAGNKLKQIEIEAQQAEAKAKGDAAAILAKAQAESEALGLKQKYATPALIMLTAAEKWDGKAPATLMSGALPVPVFDTKAEAK